MHNGRTFPGDANLLYLDDTIWDGLRNSPEFQRRKDADRESYVWDQMIEHLSGRDLQPSAEAGPELTNIEIALRVMARETRLSRRILGRGLGDFHSQKRERPLRSRIMVGTSGVVYVLMRFFPEECSEQRRAELANRCFCARHETGRGIIALGIGLTEHESNVWSVTDVVYFDLGDWSVVDDEKAAAIKDEYGYFQKAVKRDIHEDEYPAAH